MVRSCQKDKRETRPNIRTGVADKAEQCMVHRSGKPGGRGPPAEAPPHSAGRGCPELGKDLPGRRTRSRTGGSLQIPVVGDIDGFNRLPPLRPSFDHPLQSCATRGHTSMLTSLSLSNSWKARGAYLATQSCPSSASGAGGVRAGWCAPGSQKVRCCGGSERHRTDRRVQSVVGNRSAVRNRRPGAG